MSSLAALLSKYIILNKAFIRLAKRPNNGVQADAAGAAANLGTTFRRRLVPPLFLVTTASSAADADVGRLSS